jgi:hypothetical protein
MENNSHNKFVNLMKTEILSKLNATHEDFRRFELSDEPSKIFIIGTLGDRSKDFSPTGDTARTLTTVKNNSMSIRFLTGDREGAIYVRPSISLYYRTYPTYEEEKAFVKKRYEKTPEKVRIARIWKRYVCSFNPIEVDISKNSEHPLDFASFIESIKNDEGTWKNVGKLDSHSLENQTAYINAIRENSRGVPGFNWKGRILVSVEEFIQNDQKLSIVTVTLVNETGESNYETFFFNCNIEVEVESIRLEPFQYEYDYEGATYHYENHLRCLNCQAEYDKKNSRIITKHFAEFEQVKISPRGSIDSISFSFEELASEECISLLEETFELMNDYLGSFRDSKEYLENEKFRTNTDGFERVIKRFQEGIEILKNDGTALESFRLLNETFKRSSTFDGWRIFQIVFIVCLVPDIIDKTKRRDICEILHVDTGAGKTEAYLGCVIFSAFYDRLSGKKFGCTAIAKFPLRMLSIQQLQRIAGLFCWAEEIRKEKSIAGEPFSVAYFVGNTEEFPRFVKPIINNLKRSKEDNKEIDGKIIENCPICSGKVLLDYRDEERCIVHKCKQCNREFKFFYTDEEIYRFIPTFIVSTVDKLATVALNRRFKNIFGGKISECPEGHGMIPIGEKCEVELDNGNKCGKKGELCKIDFKTGPTLIIQDEMHLIRESFGTINSHFESLIENLQIELCGFGPKYIAMTATVSGSREQIKHLYHKKTNVFPGESPFGKGNKDFFFEFNLEGDKKVIQRILIGLKPNLRDNQFASLLTLKYLSEFIRKVETNLPGFSRESGIEENELKSILGNYKIFLTYHQKKTDVHSMNYYLESVANSKLETYKIRPDILTGENTLDDIKNLINRVERFFDKPENQQNILSVFATNIVSHGVDIAKWNVMIFQGIPRSTAEYIQALSRVGRKYPGLVLVWLYPNRARDLSYYQSFMDYHEILERKVENVPLSRWAKLGFKQTFTSIFNASILNFMSDIIGEPLYKVSKVNEIFSEKKNREKLIDFIKKAYISDSPMIGAEYFDARIPEETEERLNRLVEYTGGEKDFFPNALKDCDNKYYKTQYGMRGIQDEVLLVPSKYDLDFLLKVLEG